MALLAYGMVKTRSEWRNDALWTACVMGALGGMASILGEVALDHALAGDGLPPLLQAARKALLIAAAPEETIKFLALICVAERHVDARRVQDRLMLALCVALGFAALENIGYLALPGDWRRVAMLRAATAVPGHFIDGMAMGAWSPWRGCAPTGTRCAWPRRWRCRSPCMRPMISRRSRCGRSRARCGWRCCGARWWRHRASSRWRCSIACWRSPRLPIARRPTRASSGRPEGRRRRRPAAHRTTARRRALCDQPRPRLAGRRGGDPADDPRRRPAPRRRAPPGERRRLSEATRGRGHRSITKRSCQRDDGETSRN